MHAGDSSRSHLECYQLRKLLKVGGRHLTMTDPGWWIMDAFLKLLEVAIGSQ